MHTDELTSAPGHQFPDTRYMGSKRGLLDFIWSTARQLDATTVLDAFSGSGAVAYMFKDRGKSVTANDHLLYAFHNANAMVANSHVRLTPDDVADISRPSRRTRRFIRRTFSGLYFDEEDNRFLDIASTNILEISDPTKRSLAYAALSRACIKRRARGVFTYIGLGKYDDGRRDLRMTLRSHFELAAEVVNAAVFDNGTANVAYNEDIFALSVPTPDLVYIDPPYVTPHSDNDYLRRYHFVEGLSSYWLDSRAHVLRSTVTKKLRRYPTAFDRRSSIHDAFERLFAKFARSTLLVSYSSSSIPSRDEMVSILRNHKRAVSVEPFRHRYSFGTHKHKVGNPMNVVDEYLFVAN